MHAPDGCAVFLQSWWTAAFRLAAQGLNRHFREAGQIMVAPCVDGHLDHYDRASADGLKPRRHEAFLAGTEVKVNFYLPPGLSQAEFMEMLSFVGKYVGVSPFGHRDGYGRFELAGCG